MFMITTYVENAVIDVHFNWTGQDEDSGPDWETMKVYSCLPTALDSIALVEVSDLLSDAAWKKIETAIYENWKDIERQAYEQDY